MYFVNRLFFISEKVYLIFQRFSHQSTHPSAHAQLSSTLRSDISSGNVHTTELNKINSQLSNSTTGYQNREYQNRLDNVAPVNIPNRDNAYIDYRQTDIQHPFIQQNTQHYNANQSTQSQQHPQHQQNVQQQRMQQQQQNVQQIQQQRLPLSDSNNRSFRMQSNVTNFDQQQHDSQLYPHYGMEHRELHADSLFPEMLNSNNTSMQGGETMIRHIPNEHERISYRVPDESNRTDIRQEQLDYRALSSQNVHAQINQPNKQFRAQRTQPNTYFQQEDHVQPNQPNTFQQEVRVQRNQPNTSFHQEVLVQRNQPNTSFKQDVRVQRTQPNTSFQQEVHVQRTQPNTSFQQDVHVQRNQPNISFQQEVHVQRNQRSTSQHDDPVSLTYQDLDESEVSHSGNVDIKMSEQAEKQTQLTHFIEKVYLPHNCFSAITSVSFYISHYYKYKREGRSSPVSILSGKVNLAINLNKSVATCSNIYISLFMY